jgi:hypothetical protein
MTAGGKNPDLTVCQVRVAADAMAESRSMSGRCRRQFLDRKAELIAYAQVRNRRAAECHRRTTLERLKDLGVDITALRCCQIE